MRSNAVRWEQGPPFHSALCGKTSIVALGLTRRSETVPRRGALHSRGRAASRNTARSLRPRRGRRYACTVSTIRENLAGAHLPNRRRARFRARSEEKRSNTRAFLNPQSCRSAITFSSTAKRLILRYRCYPIRAVADQSGFFLRAASNLPCPLGRAFPTNAQLE